MIYYWLIIGEEVNQQQPPLVKQDPRCLFSFLMDFLLDVFEMKICLGVGRYGIIKMNWQLVFRLSLLCHFSPPLWSFLIVHLTSWLVSTLVCIEFSLNPTRKSTDFHILHSFFFHTIQLRSFNIIIWNSSFRFWNKKYF